MHVVYGHPLRICATCPQHVGRGRPDPKHKPSGRLAPYIRGRGLTAGLQQSARCRIDSTGSLNVLVPVENTSAKGIAFSSRLRSEVWVTVCTSWEAASNRNNS